MNWNYEKVHADLERWVFDNNEYVQLLAKLVADLRYEKELDPRL